MEECFLIGGGLQVAGMEARMASQKASIAACARPVSLEDQAQVVMGIGVGGADGESPAEPGLGFRVPARLP